jgi:branched-chain amino acid transport system substrate-binding protein
MTRTTRSVALASAGLLLIAGLAGCGNSKSAGTSSGGSAGSTGSSGQFAVDASSCPADATKALAAGDPIKIGTSQPLSGPLAVPGAANVAGMTAYFKKINDAGGVDGHQLELVTKDDAFDAARAVTNIQSFTGQDKVFATAAQVGTPQISATQPLLEAACVPQLWTITTSSGFTDPDNHPWTINGIPPAPVEAKAIVDYIAKKKPAGKVAEVMGADALATDFHAALPALAKTAKLTMQPAQTIPAGATNLDAQVSAAVAGSPDAIVLEALPNYAPGFLTGLARAGYKGLVVLNSSANAAGQWVTPSDPAGQGAAVPLFSKDPADPRWADDAAMKEYMTDMTNAGQAKLAKLGNALDGYNWGLLTVQNLKDAAKMKGGLTRANVMTAAWNMKVSRPLMLHPEEETNGATDPVAEEAGQIGVYDTQTKGWQPDGDWDYSGTSVEIIGQK